MKSILKFYGVLEFQGETGMIEDWIVMEPCDCELSVMRNINFTDEVFIEIAKQLFDGLTYLHDLNIAHCDLKPNNILVKNHPNPSELFSDWSEIELKFIDFNISTDFNDKSIKTINYLGTKKYMAPEIRFQNHKNIEVSDLNIFQFKGDVYSLGLTLLDIY